MSPNLAPSAALILAAGQGKRMRSRLPKILHACHEVPLFAHPVARALAAGCAPVVVVASPDHRAAIAAEVQRRFPGGQVRVTTQPAPLGTGDAARCGLEALGEPGGGAGRLLVLYGDTPLLTDATLERLRAAEKGQALALLTATVPDPTGLGRVVRDAGGRVSRVVEHRDASSAEAAICEVNVGVYWLQTALLRRMVGTLSGDNAQGELYLTDCVAMAAAAGGACGVAVDDLDEMRGVNSRAELQAAEQIWRRRTLRRHQEAGVTFHDPIGTFVGPDVEIGHDCDIGEGVQLRGRTRLAVGVVVEGPAVLVDTQVEEEARVRAFSHLEGAVVGSGATVGPMARLRPGAKLAARSHVGNFVEIKNAQLQEGAKVNHLSYIGDAVVGAGSNVGAGSITCNYDGVAKHHTQIGERTFIGSHATLVAPLRVGDDAFVAAGSTVTQDVPAGALALGRARQVTKEGRGKELKARLAAAPRANTTTPKSSKEK